MYKTCTQNEITLAHEQTLHLKGSPIEPSNKPSVSLPHFILTLEPGPIPAAAFYEAGMARHVPHPPGLPRRTQSPAAGLENLGSSREEKPRDLQTSCLCMHCLHCLVWRRLGAQCKHLGHTRHPQGPCPAGLGQPPGLPMQK